MSGTNMILGSWKPDEWPEYVTVSHEGIREAGRIYVPERTCEMLPSDTETTCTVHYRTNGCSVDYEYGYKRCSCCDADIVDCETLRFCPYCGARVE